MVKKCNLIFIALLMIQLIMIDPTAASSPDYTLEDGRRVPIPQSYIHVDTLYNGGAAAEGIVYFEQPQDMFISGDALYVADTGNNRVVKLSISGELLGVYAGPADDPLRGPSGIYVDQDGDMYVADTSNNRIVHLAADGEFVEQSVTPESELLRDSFALAPSKLLISSTGYIYTVKGQNIMAMDAHNRFRGFLGQSEIGFSIIDVFIRMFASEEQQRKIASRNAPYYINLTMDEKGFVYATSLDPEGEIKKLNSLGLDMYKYRSNLEPLGERVDQLTGKAITPQFVDIAVSKQGIITVIEVTSGKLYQYDQEGNLLTVFGGKGEQQGRFTMPSAIEIDDNGRIYVLDSVLGSIQIFEPTYFIEQVHEAIVYYGNAEYSLAYENWKQVLAIDENYQLAHIGLANSLYKQEQWSQAMHNYELAGHKENYSKAFAEYRYQLFREYFFVVVLLGVLAIVLLVYTIKWLRRIAFKTIHEVENSTEQVPFVSGVLLSLGVLFQPSRTYELIISTRGRLNYLSAALVLLAAFIVHILYLSVVHFPLASLHLVESNLLLEAVILLVPPVTWVLANFFVSAIMDGESRIGEIFVAASYSMVVYALFNIPLMLLSNVLSGQEASFYNVLYAGMWIWLFLLFFLSNKVMNDYTMLKSSVTYVLSGFTIVLMWAVAILGYVMTGRLYVFITGIIQEIRIAFF